MESVFAIGVNPRAAVHCAHSAMPVNAHTHTDRARVRRNGCDTPGGDNRNCAFVSGYRLDGSNERTESGSGTAESVSADRSGAPATVRSGTTPAQTL